MLLKVSFYELSKSDRDALVREMNECIMDEIRSANKEYILTCFSDEDTYVRKAAYLSIGRIHERETELVPSILDLLTSLMPHENPKVRQTVVNTAGEIGKRDFATVEDFFSRGLFDEHHSVRNAVIGSIKKMGQVNPLPVLAWANRYLHHPDKETRREICHGIELRGRTHPEDILPMLKELQFDKTARVKNTLVHVLGQIAYKRGCLEKVTTHLKEWDNAEIVAQALEEIIDVHDRYKNFSYYTQEECRAHIAKHFKLPAA